MIMKMKIDYFKKIVLKKMIVKKMKIKLIHQNITMKINFNKVPRKKYKKYHLILIIKINNIIEKIYKMMLKEKKYFLL